MKKMKVIRISNFDLDNVSDVLIAENVSSYYAEQIAILLNEKFGGDRSPYFYKPVEEDYKLYKSEE